MVLESAIKKNDFIDNNEKVIKTSSNSCLIEIQINQNPIGFETPNLTNNKRSNLTVKFDLFPKSKLIPNLTKKGKYLLKFFCFFFFKKKKP